MSLMGLDPVLIGETADHHDPLLDGLRQFGPVLIYFNEQRVGFSFEITADFTPQFRESSLFLVSSSASGIPLRPLHSGARSPSASVLLRFVGGLGSSPARAISRG